MSSQQFIRLINKTIPKQTLMPRYFLVFFMCLFVACTSDKKAPPSTTTDQHNHEDHQGHDHHPDSYRDQHSTNHSGLFQKHGIQFSIPQDWSILEGEIPGGGQYISVEKQGEDESGRVAISILPKQLPLQSHIETVKNQFVAGMKPTGNAITFTDNKTEVYQDLETLACQHSFTNVGLDFSGDIRVFHCGTQSINIFTIEAKADSDKNKAGFDLINQTFSCTF